MSLLKVPALDDAPMDEPIKSTGGRHIRVIEDNPADAYLVQRVLLNEGYSVTVAHSASLGLAIPLETKPFAILLDIMMPAMNGSGVLKVINAHATLRECPVIVVSVNDDIQKGRDGGASAHLVKPVHREPSLRKIARFIEPFATARSEVIPRIEVGERA